MIYNNLSIHLANQEIFTLKQAKKFISILLVSLSFIILWQVQDLRNPAVLGGKYYLTYNSLLISPFREKLRN